jgi:hypothetical protein
MNGDCEGEGAGVVGSSSLMDRGTAIPGEEGYNRMFGDEADMNEFRPQEDEGD